MIQYLIILILVFIVIFKSRYYENFSLSIYDNSVPPSYNNNYDKIWLRPNKSVNSSNIQDLPSREYLTKNKFNMIKNIEYSNEMNDIFMKYVKNNNIKKDRILYYVENSESKDDMTKLINNLNKESWVNKKMNLDKNIRLNYKLKVCSIKDVNKILNKVYSIINYKFVIYKYKINNVSKYQNGVRSYGLVIVILQEFGQFGYTIYISGHINNNKVIFDGYDFIGHYYTSNFLNNGMEYNNWNTYTQINKDQKINTPDKIEKVKKNIFDNYKCFSTDNDINNKNNQSIFFLSYFNKGNM